MVLHRGRGYASRKPSGAESCFVKFTWGAISPCPTSYTTGTRELPFYLAAVRTTKMTSEGVTQVDIPQGAGYLTEEYAVRWHWIRRILTMFGVDRDDPVRDCFASHANRRFDLMFTAEENALVQEWDPRETMWCNPPWTIWPATAQKILGCKCRVVAIFPCWHSKRWVQDLLYAADKIMYFESGSRVFEIGGKPTGGIRWGLYAALIHPGHAEVATVSWSKSARRRWRRKQLQHADGVR